MILSPKKLLAVVTANCQERLEEPIVALGVFMPRSPLVRGETARETKRRMKRAVAVAVTPTAIHAFAYKDRGYVGVGRVKEEVASWPRAGVEVVRGEGTQVLQNLDYAVPLKQHVVGLRFPDGQTVLLALTPLGRTVRDMEESFVEELMRTS